MELARLFFLGLARPEERAAAIRDYIRQMEETGAVLQAIRERFRQAAAGAAALRAGLGVHLSLSGIHHRVRHCRRGI